MFKIFKVKISQGKQFVPNLKKASPKGFRGLPVISKISCENSCQACIDSCPTNAMTINPVTIDLGRCVFCNQCAVACPEDKIFFSETYKMSASSLGGLIVDENTEEVAVKTSESIRKVFGRSLKLRSVSSGGCNACELELNAAGNVNFDMGRFGIDFISSPRHADGLVLSGPLTDNMAKALELAYEGMPDPKFIISVGACTLSGGLYQNSTTLNRIFLEKFKPSLYIPGCPIHPLTFINGILDLLGQ